MRLLPAGACAVVVLSLAACGGHGSRKPEQAATRGALQPGWLSEPTTELGYVDSLTPLGQGYELRLDLHARFGPDATGLAACIDSHECPAGTKGFPDDTYDHDFRYVVTYYVPPGATVALVGATGATTPRVTARYLYGMAHGRNPRRVRAMTTTGADVLREFAFNVRVVDRCGPAKCFTPRSYREVDRLAQLFHP